MIKPDVVLIAMTAPKQEKIAGYVKKYSFHNFDHIFCVGAVIDYLALSIKVPSLLVTKYGFEWLYRFTVQPLHVWKRIFITGPLFFLNFPHLQQISSIFVFLSTN